MSDKIHPSPHASDDVTVGQLVRFINQQHLNAAMENPQNRDYMLAMQRIGQSVEDALHSFRMFSDPTPAERISNGEHK